MKSKIKHIAFHVYYYRARYAVAATAVGMTYAGYKLTQRNVEELNVFLEERGLLEEFYAPAELVS